MHNIPQPGDATPTVLARVGRVETITLLLLLVVGLPLKYWYGDPAAVRLLGPVHGSAWVCYLWMAWRDARLSGSEWLRLVAGSLVPLGTWYNERWLRERVGA